MLHYPFGEKIGQSLDSGGSDIRRRQGGLGCGLVIGDSRTGPLVGTVVVMHISKGGVYVLKNKGGTR